MCDHGYQLRNLERMCEFLIHRVHHLEWQIGRIGDKVAPLPDPRSEEWKRTCLGDEVMHKYWIKDLYWAGLPRIARQYRTGDDDELRGHHVE